MSITFNPNNVENAYAAVYNGNKEIPSKSAKATEVNISPDQRIIGSWAVLYFYI